MKVISATHPQPYLLEQNDPYLQVILKQPIDSSFPQDQVLIQQQIATL